MASYNYLKIKNELDAKATDRFDELAAKIQQ